MAVSSPPADPLLAGAIRRARSGRPLITVVISEDLLLWQAAAELSVVLPDAEVVAVSSDLAFPDLLRLLSSTTLLITDDAGLYQDASGLGTLTLVVDPEAERDDIASPYVGPEPHRVARVAKQLLERATSRPAARQDGLAARRAEEAMAWMFGLQPSPPVMPAARQHAGEGPASHLEGTGRRASQQAERAGRGAGLDLTIKTAREAHEERNRFGPDQPNGTVTGGSDHRPAEEPVPEP
jgi:hypothetical protein